MNDQNTQLATQADPLALDTFEGMERFSGQIAKSGMFGITNPSQALCLMMICRSKGLHPVAALETYHIIEGKPSMKSEAMLAKFIASGGGVIWHIRADEMVGATFFADKKTITDASRTRSIQRFNAMWDMFISRIPEQRGEMIVNIAKLSVEGEETIIRTFKDCDDKGLTKGRNGIKDNWRTSPRQMLTARVITEGVKLVSPGLIAGLYTPDELEDAAGSQPERQSSDVQSMQAILDQHMENANNATNDNERRRFLGLAAEIRVKMEDDKLPMEHKPENVKQIEQPAEPKQQEVKEVHAEAEVVKPERFNFEEYVLKAITKRKEYAGKPLGALTPEQIEKIYLGAYEQGITHANPDIREDARALKLAYDAIQATKGGK